MNLCPACGAQLLGKKLSREHVDGCPSCGGAWLDRGELQALAKSPGGLRTMDLELRPGLQPNPSPVAGNLCPRCDQPLAEFEYQSLRGVRLRWCRTCEGVWLNHGEAAALADRLGQPAAPPPRPRAPPQASEVPAGGGLAPALGVGGAGAWGAAERAAPLADGTSTAGLPVVRGRPIPGVRGGGFGDSVERGMAFIKAAYSLALERPSLLAPLAVGALAQLVLGAGILAIALRLSQDASAAHTVKAWFASHAGEVAAAGVAFLLLTQAANAAVTGMTVNLVDGYLKGFEPDWRVALRDVLKNAGGLLAVAVIGTLVELMTPRNKRGVARIIGTMIQEAWTVLSFLLIPVIVIEDCGLGRALARVRDIHSRGLMQIAVGEVGLRAIAGIAGMALFAFYGMLGWALAPLTPAKMALLGAPFLLTVAAISVVNAFARGAYYTCLYLWAAEVERHGGAEGALVPGPLAGVLER